MCVCPSGSQSANIYDIYGEKRARALWTQPIPPLTSRHIISIGALGKLKRPQLLKNMLYYTILPFTIIIEPSQGNLGVFD